MDWKSRMILLCNNEPKSTECDTKCLHEDLIEDSDSTICSECGTIVNRKLTTENSFSSKTARRRPTQCPVYTDIPEEFDSSVRNLTVTIYKTVTVRRIYRSTLRKAIIAACLYRASVILNKSTRRCFTSFGLTNTEANRGIVFVASNLPPGDYAISLFGDKSEIYAACSIVGITGDDVDYVFSLFEKVRHGCDCIMASSQRISIIYGCIWAFVKTFPSINYPNTIGDLVGLLLDDTCGEKKRGMLPVSTATINKKYNEITKFILSRVMKTVFSLCLSLVCTEDYLVSKTPTIPITLYDYTIPEKITMIADDGFIYPLEDVDDVTDWNILFNMSYATSSGEEVLMPIRIVSKSKTATVSFDECPLLVAEMGKFILEDAIRQFIKISK